MYENLAKILLKEKLFPIIRSHDIRVVRDTAQALIDGGAKIFEINVENPGIYRVIEEMSDHACICAGGIITSMQAQTAIAAGAKILSSPIFQMNLVKISKDKQIPFIAGTSTANEAYNAWKARIPIIKIFPITAMGGVSYVQNILRPMSFLNIMPIGDVKLSEVKSYINAGAKAVGVGRDLTEGRTYTEIAERVKKALEELRN